MAETIDDLKVTLEDLIARRVALSYEISGAQDYACLEKLAMVQTAIVALEAVIASGAEAPEIGSLIG